MIIAWLTRIFGGRFAVPTAIGALLFAVIALSLLVRSCGRDDTAQRQAEQTSRSGEALSGAAKNAVETVSKSGANEAAIDAGTRQTTKEIENANDPAAVRRAVLDGVCQRAAHRNDPACRVR